MFSGLPRTADIEVRDWHVSVGPIPDSRTAANASLFDHLGGAGEQRGRQVEAERFCGLEVDDKLELGRLLDRKLASALACKDSGDISRRGAIKFKVVGRVAH